MSLMKDGRFITKKDFLNFVEREIIPQLKPAEAKRKVIIITWGLGSFILVGVLFWYFKDPLYIMAHSQNETARKFASWMYIGLFLIPIIGILRIWFHIWGQKDVYYPMFLKHLDLKGYQGLIKQDFIEEMRLDKRGFDKWNRQDGLTGTIEGTTFYVQEGDWEKKIKFEKRHDYSFNYTYIAFPVPLKITKHTIILNQKHFIRFPPEREEVELEDIEFTKKFRVFSHDQIEARRILTPIFIERLKEMSKAFFARRVDVSFYKGYILIRVRTKKDMFEPFAGFSMFRPLTSMKRFETFYDEVATVCHMIRALKIENQEQVEQMEKERKAKLYQ